MLLHRRTHLIEEFLERGNKEKFCKSSWQHTHTQREQERIPMIYSI